MRYNVELPWSNFKTDVLDASFWNSLYFDVGNHYFLFGKQNEFTVACKIYKDSGADQLDFEENYKDGITNQVTDNIKTRFEDENLVLKLVRLSGQADANGDLILNVPVPGEFPQIGRYAAGFWAFTDNYDWDDKVQKVEIIDADGLTGAPEGTVLKTYHENELDEENEGWFFWRTFGDEGECEVEPIGYYGQVNAGLVVRMTFKVQPLAKVKVNGWWGKNE